MDHPQVKFQFLQLMDLIKPYTSEHAFIAAFNYLAPETGTHLKSSPDRWRYRGGRP